MSGKRLFDDGETKYRIIRAALLGGVLNVLVTDEATTQWLITEPGMEVPN